ncbi:hypothetical protein LZD49_31640 [Dyadobacter sp. CY261]|uniref:hypothetical protein n=1 Tax=Dyadobacter sp. CY261 TaxID=2907203 RepID=UPI001F3C0AB1|nr:hypothetical protein [Dyadobacter sp. CY261]MCF0075080.1 hypothetical protein [Dyadobacter sp. CY261]
MNRQLCLLLLLLLKLHAGYAQNKQPVLVSAASQAKRVNTYPLFETNADKPAKPDKKSDDVVEKPIANLAKSEMPATVPVPAKAVSSKPTVESKKVAFDPEAISTVYFNKRFAQTSNKDNAYFYRQAKFDRVTNQPRGTVKDFYAHNDKPKFEGQFSKYENTYEERNTDFDGICKFYEENGSYITRTYSKKRLTKEVKYNATGDVTAETEFDNAGRRKAFSDYILDKNGNKVGLIKGAFNTRTNREEAVKQLQYENGKLKSEVDLINSCPVSKALYYTEGGMAHEVYFQDFTCEPAGGWKFTNKSFFSTSLKSEPAGFQVKAVGTKGEFGTFQMPINYDFADKSFEILAVFDLATEKPMAEFGIVWEYIDNSNYSFLKINTATKTFEVNAVKLGIVQKYMTGIRQPSLEFGKNEVTLSFKSSQQGKTYSLNGQPLQYLKGSEPVNFDKFARTDPGRESKIWNVGAYFKPASINEGIILKSIEVKIL